MGAALTIFVLLSVSVFVVRIAAVALRLTGLSDSSARFQALSAFTGTGFTTSEAETIVNYPLRRRIASLLMIIGNMGLVSVFATVVVSLVNTEGEVSAVAMQVAWLIAGLFLLWFLMLSPRADQYLCGVIAKVLRATTLLGQRHYERLVQVDDGYSVCEHPVQSHWLTDECALDSPDIGELGLQVLAVRHPDGTISTEGFSSTATLVAGTLLVIYGLDKGHDVLETAAAKGTGIGTE
jgi:hypothetical protein